MTYTQYKEKITPKVCIYISLIAQLKALFLFGLYLNVYIYVLGKKKKT